MKKLFAILAITIFVIGFCVAAEAQTGFVASSDALAINCGSGWGAGNLTTESYDLIDYGVAKSNRIFAQGVELTAPNCGLSVYGGGVQWQPDISALLKKTNLPCLCGRQCWRWHSDRGSQPRIGSHRRRSQVHLE